LQKKVENHRKNSVFGYNRKQFGEKENLLEGIIISEIQFG